MSKDPRAVKAATPRQSGIQPPEPAAARM